MRVLALLVAPAIAQIVHDERVQDLVSNMTTNEKFSLLNGIGWSMVWILPNCRIAPLPLKFLVQAAIQEHSRFYLRVFLNFVSGHQLGMDHPRRVLRWQHPRGQPSWYPQFKHARRGSRI